MPIESRACATSILVSFVLLVGSLGNNALAASGGRNSAENLDQPYLILISIDGFGWNYRDLYDTPALDQIADSGVEAASLRPVFPTLTFPNHFSIATGLYPAEHGIVHNHFPNEARDAWYRLWDRAAVEDGSWYAGEPIWVVAEKHGMVSAAFYFVGTEAPVAGIRPTYWYSYNKSVSARERVNQVLDWLQLPAVQRPHLITLYFENVDDAGHDFGQGSRELEEAVSLIDDEIGRLREGIDAMGLGDQVVYFVLSDHGQAGYRNPDTVLILEEHIELDGLIVEEGGSYAWIYQHEPDRDAAVRLRDAINANWTFGTAYLREDAPTTWRLSDSLRYPEIFVVPDLNYGVVAERGGLYQFKRGDHGWAPDDQAMHGFFIASGPGIAAGQKIDTIDAVEVFGMMLEVFGFRDPRQRSR